MGITVTQAVVRALEAYVKDQELWLRFMRPYERNPRYRRPGRLPRRETLPSPERRMH
jgi:hypothetical protein